MAVPEVLRCVLCHREFSPREVQYTCPFCGLDGTLDVLYDMEKLRRKISRNSFRSGPPNLWRYREILPVEKEEHCSPLSAGNTPLYSLPSLASDLGIGNLWIKDDGRNPTASLKDRASAVGVAKALDFEQPAVACASTGNAASSLAGFAAVAGLPAYIFVPEKAPAAKVAQLLVYGATVVLVEGNYEAAFHLATEAIEHYGWYNRNCAINPYLVEGKKTCGLEIAEELAWEVPDRIIISVGDGCCISGIYKAFRDLLDLGLVERMPKITGVQAAACAPLAKAIQEGADTVQFVEGGTLADSIDVGAPRNWAKALRAVRESRGSMITVSDEAILQAIPELARKSGVFAEPAGSAAFAGLLKMAGEGLLDSSEKVAVVITGNGLKDIESARKSVGAALKVAPDLKDLQKKLGKIGS
ncbi:MAG TPA: threonine synthase [Synergistaceae bacterium]|nr:threonine synthase [Synergistaceae bacterium]HPQ36622.1 threonine synthase [Synergistaceae bacterium]